MYWLLSVNFVRTFLLDSLGACFTHGMLQALKALFKVMRGVPKGILECMFKVTGKAPISVFQAYG